MRRGVLVVVAIALATGCMRPVEQEPWAICRKPLVEVRRAAFLAFERINIDVKVDDTNYIEGMRPLRMKGMGIWLDSLEPERTRVRIQTVYGGTAQTDWTPAVFRDMRRMGMIAGALPPRV